jgi:hypothetical protein
MKNTTCSKKEKRKEEKSPSGLKKRGEKKEK